MENQKKNLILSNIQLPQKLIKFSRKSKAYNPNFTDKKWSNFNKENKKLLLVNEKYYYSNIYIILN